MDQYYHLDHSPYNHDKELTMSNHSKALKNIARRKHAARVVCTHYRYRRQRVACGQSFQNQAHQKKTTAVKNDRKHRPNEKNRQKISACDRRGCVHLLCPRL
ncbi:unnamed protein product [Ectocarpus sp. 4 AP-2014]